MSGPEDRTCAPYFILTQNICSSILASKWLTYSPRASIQPCGSHTIRPSLPSSIWHCPLPTVNRHRSLATGYCSPVAALYLNLIPKCEKGDLPRRGKITCSLDILCHFLEFTPFGLSRQTGAVSPFFNRKVYSFSLFSAGRGTLAKRTSDAEGDSGVIRARGTARQASASDHADTGARAFNSTPTGRMRRRVPPGGQILYELNLHQSDTPSSPPHVLSGCLLSTDNLHITQIENRQSTVGNHRSKLHLPRPPV
jgi:hypothetical protein